MVHQHNKDEGCRWIQTWDTHMSAVWLITYYIPRLHYGCRRKGSWDKNINGNNQYLQSRAWGFRNWVRNIHLSGAWDYKGSKSMPLLWAAPRAKCSHANTSEKSKAGMLCRSVGDTEPSQSRRWACKLLMEIKRDPIVLLNGNVRAQ